KTVPERFVHALRQMRVDQDRINEVHSEYVGKAQVPLEFCTVTAAKHVAMGTKKLGLMPSSGDGVGPSNSEKRSEKCPSPRNITAIEDINSNSNSNNNVNGNGCEYYYPPFKYARSECGSVVRLKRHLHDLNVMNAHNVAYALEACLHNFPPVFIPEDLFNDESDTPEMFFDCMFQEMMDEKLSLAMHTEIPPHLLAFSSSSFSSSAIVATTLNSNKKSMDKRLPKGNEDDFKLDKITTNSNSSLFVNAHVPTEESLTPPQEIVWQALMHACRSEEYRQIRDNVCFDSYSTSAPPTKKINDILPALEVNFFFFCLERKTKKKNPKIVLSKQKFFFFGCF
ncbi:hypothetical protein RFI_28122, partial [Reticulomyxa filosa]